MPTVMGPQITYMFQSNDYGRRAAILLETTRRALGNQSQSKQRSTLITIRLIQLSTLFASNRRSHLKNA